MINLLALELQAEKENTTVDEILSRIEKKNKLKHKIVNWI